jgi:uncharacterized phage protein (TIGR02220 family)
MLSKFLNTLYQKPNEYQLFWVFILGHIDEKETVEVSITKIKRKFNVSTSSFYRMLSFGLSFFEDENSEINIIFKNAKLFLHKNNISKNNDYFKKQNNSDIAINVINYLNEKAGKKFSTKSKGNFTHINARIKEGYTEDDFKKVIDVKCEKWLNTKFDDYLRPHTLFSLKMESYLNETKNIPVTNERFRKTQNAVDEAKQIDWFGNK